MTAQHAGTLISAPHVPCDDVPGRAADDTCVTVSTVTHLIVQYARHAASDSVIHSLQGELGDSSRSEPTRSTNESNGCRVYMHHTGHRAGTVSSPLRLLLCLLL